MNDHAVVEDSDVLAEQTRAVGRLGDDLGGAEEAVDADHHGVKWDGLGEVGGADNGTASLKRPYGDGQALGLRGALRVLGLDALHAMREQLAVERRGVQGALHDQRADGSEGVLDDVVGLVQALEHVVGEAAEVVHAGRQAQASGDAKMVAVTVVVVLAGGVGGEGGGLARKGNVVSYACAEGGVLGKTRGVCEKTRNGCSAPNLVSSCDTPA